MFWRLGVECILQVLSHGIFACLWNSISLRCFFVAAGRAPNSKRLNLETVGVELDNTGAIKVHISLFQSLDSMKSNKKKLFSFQHLDDRWIHCDSIILDCGIHSWLYKYKHKTVFYWNTNLQMPDFGYHVDWCAKLLESSGEIVKYKGICISNPFQEEVKARWRNTNLQMP